MHLRADHLLKADIGGKPKQSEIIKINAFYAPGKSGMPELLTQNPKVTRQHTWRYPTEDRCSQAMWRSQSAGLFDFDANQPLMLTNAGDNLLNSTSSDLNAGLAPQIGYR